MTNRDCKLHEKNLKRASTMDTTFKSSPPSEHPRHFHTIRPPSSNSYNVNSIKVSSSDGQMMAPSSFPDGVNTTVSSSNNNNNNSSSSSSSSSNNNNSNKIVRKTNSPVSIATQILTPMLSPLSAEPALKEGEAGAGEEEEEGGGGGGGEEKPFTKFCRAETASISYDTSPYKYSHSCLHAENTASNNNSGNNNNNSAVNDVEVMDIDHTLFSEYEDAFRIINQGNEIEGLRKMKKLAHTSGIPYALRRVIRYQSVLFFIIFILIFRYFYSNFSLLFFFFFSIFRYFVLY